MVVCVPSSLIASQPGPITGMQSLTPFAVFERDHYVYEHGEQG